MLFFRLMKADTENGNKAIAAWMRANLDAHIDPQTGELNCTALVEAWDIEKSTGGVTLDPNHPAWEIAVKVADQRDRADRSKNSRRI